ncbi:uncharacterized protein LOC120128148 [Hibiscus syriacus]|uniref:uncharacterized protein LOC120128148 n=1 Tax=Hibiscus syriacus TaxID=106335 RepID=UPI0019240FFC|nr:uncharacterized protein LOC120128148 [Hibiscus syriacus]
MVLSGRLRFITPTFMEVLSDRTQCCLLLFAIVGVDSKHKCLNPLCPSSMFLHPLLLPLAIACVDHTWLAQAIIVVILLYDHRLLHSIPYRSWHILLDREDFTVVFLSTGQPEHTFYSHYHTDQLTSPFHASSSDDFPTPPDCPPLASDNPDYNHRGCSSAVPIKENLKGYLHYENK